MFFRLDCRIHVAIMLRAAMRACPLSHGQWQAFQFVPARRAPLAAGIEAISYHDMPTAHVSLYSNCRRNSKKLMSAIDRARWRFAIMPRTFKFDADGVEAARQIRRELVQSI